MSVVINGSAGVTTNSGAVYNGISAGTAVASTSGTSIDFTSIPSWVKRITVMLYGVSTSSTSIPLLQLGYSGGIENTSYFSNAGMVSTTSNTTRGTQFTTGFGLNWSTAAADILNGSITITNISANKWLLSGTLGNENGANSNIYVSGRKETTGTLDRVRITTVNGTDTFDAGSINILYE